MKKVLIMPVLAAVLFAAACGEDGDPTEPPPVVPTASVRFFNATTGMAGNGGFTTNGQFATGSAVAFGQSTQTCPKVNAGSTSFGFGAANTGGTGLNGSALATLDNKSIAADGNYTVAATGSTTNPTLFLLDNNFTTTLGTSQAAVRFVNLAPGTGTTPNTFNVYLDGGNAPIAFKIAVGVPTAYIIGPSGSRTVSIGQGHSFVIPSSAFTLQAGTASTFGIVPNPSGGFQLINIPAC